MPPIDTARSTAEGAKGTLVHRGRLLTRLVSDSNARVVSIVAPAGYGKTTLVDQWETADDRDFARVATRPRHNDPTVLLGEIAAALNEIEAVDGEVFAPLSAPTPDVSDVILPRLCEALRRRTVPFVLELSDLDHLDDAGLLGELAEAIPSGSQLAVSARTEPAMRLARRRANGQLAEIGADALAMTTGEATELVRAAGLELGATATALIVERTEGWPAGLALAVLYLQSQDDPDAAAARFQGDDRMVAEYLQEEFLASLPAEELDFLIRTSVPEELSGESCDFLLERQGSAATLRSLAESNHLVVRLDRRDHRYRYHALLRDMLAAELHRFGNEAEQDLHARASQWCADHDDVESAISHAVLGSDVERAGELIWGCAPDYAAGGRTATLGRWLDSFSKEQIADLPTLALTQATKALADGDGATIEHSTGVAITRLEGDPHDEAEALRVVARMTRAFGAARGTVTQMGTDLEGVYDLLPPESPWRSICRLGEGTMHYLLGERETARGLLEEGERYGDQLAPSVQTVCLAQLALLAIDEHQLDHATALIDRALAKTELFGLGETTGNGLVHATAALVHAMRGRSDEASRDARRATQMIEVLRDLSYWYEAEARIVLARAWVLLDEVATARKQLADAGRFLHRAEDAFVLREWAKAAWDATETAASVLRWPLTPAELRLLPFLPTHLSFREIAEELILSPNTVKSQARSIYGKLGVTSRAEAVAFARTVGLLTTSADEVPPVN